MSVTFAKGFRAAGVVAGLKASGTPDVAVVINDGPDQDAAAVFTSNRIAAAPVLWSQQVIMDGRLRAVVLNSGGANACTGPEGFADTHHTAEAAAEALGVGPIDVAICSTGLIGERLDMPKLLPAVGKPSQGGSSRRSPLAAEAIMTTDSVPKTATFEAGYRIGGMAKVRACSPRYGHHALGDHHRCGDRAQALDRAFRAAVAATFDRVDADGCMSTNDTVIVMASGASGACRRDFHRRVAAGVRGSVAATGRGRRRASKAHRRHGDSCSQRGRGRGCRPRSGAQRVVQVCDVRRGPELGQGPVGRGNH